MLTKTRCMSLLDDIAGYAHRANIGPNGINEINEDYNGLKKLIEEHFNHKPLKFEEIKKHTWVWDNKHKSFLLIDITYETKKGKRVKFKTIDFNGYCKFEENRFYSITIPSIGDKNG